MLPFGRVSEAALLWRRVMRSASSPSLNLSTVAFHEHRRPLYLLGLVLALAILVGQIFFAISQFRSASEDQRELVNALEQLEALRTESPK